MKMRTGLILAIQIVAMVLILPAANANELITIAFTGKVTRVTDYYGHLEDKVHADDTFTGNYTFYPLMPEASQYHYTAGHAGFYVNINNLIFQTDLTQVDVSIEVHSNRFTGDRYEISSLSNLPLANGTEVGVIVWALKDLSGNALPDSLVPHTAPDLSKWTSMNFFWVEQYGDYDIAGTITSVTLIPEPVSVSLFGAALILARRYRRK